jgi:CBS domain-containing protein
MMTSRGQEEAVRTRIPLREIMNSPVQTVDLEEPVTSVARLMSSLRIGSVVVTKGGKPCGIITDGDIVGRVVAHDRRAGELRAGHVMTKGLTTIEDEADMTRATRMMISNRVKRLGVVRKGELVGIISMSDILRVTPEVLDVMSEKTRMITGEGRQRTASYVAGFCDQCNEWSDYLLDFEDKFMCDDCRSEPGAEEQADNL